MEDMPVIQKDKVKLILNGREVTIKKGMSFAEVKSALGPPDEIHQGDVKAVEKFYAQYYIGHNYYYFYFDKGSEKLVDFWVNGGY